MLSKADDDLIRQIILERLVSSIAKDFIQNEYIEDSINNALKQIGEMSQASRAYVFEFHTNDTLMSNSFEWCSEGVSAEINNLQDLPASTFPMWMKWLGEGKVLNISNVDKMSEEAQAEKDILQSQGIMSLLVLPLSYNNKLQGFVGFDNCYEYNVWLENDEALLSIMAEVFSSAFARKQKEQQLQATNKQLEVTIEKLKSLQSQLLIQEQMAAIGQLAAGVAHEINNPLGFIMSNTSVLNDYIADLIDIIKKHNLFDDEISFIINDVPNLITESNEGLNRVKGIVDSLRYFSRIDSIIEFDNYNIEEGIDNTLIMLNSRIKYLCKIEKNFAANVPLITANAGRLNQVILNIVVNALDAIEENCIQGQGVITIKVYNDDENVYVEIIDNGGGIADEHINNIFKPFYTTKPVGKGTGFGLSIVYDTVVNLHKGEIKVDSTVGVGTCFTIVLPIE